MNTTQREIGKISDPLGETLHQLRLNGSLYCRSILTEPWGIEMPAIEGKMMFHIVTRGSCWLKVGDDEAVLLRQGSMVMVPHGEGHQIASDPSSALTALFDIPVEQVSERYEVMRHGGQGHLTELMCCVVSFDHVAGQHLISQLPTLLLVDGMGAETDDWIQSTLRFITQEAGALKPGGETIVTHLADILVIQAIRQWISSAPEATEGWLAALKDRYVGKALAVIHNEPERHWTVGTLAQEVGMSRSGFSARFTELVGDSAKRYLTNLRMQMARKILMNDPAPIAVVAEQFGYGSEAAFSRAFKRSVGVSPGSVRHEYS